MCQIVRWKFGVDFLAHSLHGDFLQIRLRQNVLQIVLDVIIWRCRFLAFLRQWLILALLIGPLAVFGIVVTRLIFLRVIVGSLLLLRRTWSSTLRPSLWVFAGGCCLWLSRYSLLLGSLTIVRLLLIVLRFWFGLLILSLAVFLLLAVASRLTTRCTPTTGGTTSGTLFLGLIITNILTILFAFILIVIRVRIATASPFTTAGRLAISSCLLFLFFCLWVGAATRWIILK